MRHEANSSVLAARNKAGREKEKKKKKEGDQTIGNAEIELRTCSRAVQIQKYGAPADAAERGGMCWQTDLRPCTAVQTFEYHDVISTVGLQCLIEEAHSEKAPVNEQVPTC